MGASFGNRAAVGRPRTTLRAARSAPAPDTEASVFVEPMHAQPHVPFFEWLLDTRTAAEETLRPHEQRLLARLDAVLAADSSRAELLPRAPAVIPQLMNSLRDERQSAQALAERVAKDPNLVAEVIRLANSALARGGQAVGDLPQAIARLGTQGLRRAIARVVLRPIFDAPDDSLSGRAAPRLWRHSEVKAAECMRLAAAAGLDPFEGYLAGLMHDIGWTAALRALDRASEAGRGLPTQFSRAFVPAFETRREMFFAMLVMHWQITDSLTALAAELLDGGFAAARSPLAQALRAADRNASLDMLRVGALLEPMTVAPPGP